MPKKKTKLMPWNVQDFLKDKESIKAYLDAAFDDPESNWEFKKTAFDDAIRAYGRIYGLPEQPDTMDLALWVLIMMTSSYCREMQDLLIPYMLKLKEENPDWMENKHKKEQQ